MDFKDTLLLPFLTKNFAFEVKAVDEAEGTFDGYASVFGNIDSYDEVVDKGAFTKTIQENSQRVKVCWNHDWYEPIGRPIKMEEDNHGLFVKSKISSTQRGKDTLTLLRDGVVTELSIGFQTMKDEYETLTGGRVIRHLKEIRLWEYSPVTWAANDLALITGVHGVCNPLEGKLGLLTDFAHYLGNLAQLKEGRVLSKANLDLVSKAIEALQALLSAAQPEDDSTGGDDAAAKVADIDEAELKAILDSLQAARGGLQA
jgi:HK97 family phage prohead protease